MTRTSRRQWLNRAAGASLAAMASPSIASSNESQGGPPAAPVPTAGAAGHKDKVSVSRRGQYEKTALRSDFVNVAAIQSRVRAVDGNNPGPAPLAPAQSADAGRIAAAPRDPRRQARPRGWPQGAVW